MPKMITNLMYSMVVAGLTTSSIAQVVTVRETSMVEPEDFPSFTHFGHAVSYGVGRMIASSPHDARFGERAGVVSVFLNSGNRSLLTLAAFDIAAGDEFGWSIAANQHDLGRVVVGAPGNDALGADSGAAYLFNFYNGAELVKYLPDNGQAGDAFGSAVGLDIPDNQGGVAVVGAPAADLAYVFDALTGTQLMMLSDSGLAGETEFGFSIVVDEDVIVVGAPSDLVGTRRSGAVYVFDRSNGALVHRIVSMSGSDGSRFGHAISVSDGKLFVGAPKEGRGHAYAFDLSTGDSLYEMSPLTGSDAEFGSSISADGRFYVYVGAPGDNQAEIDTGSVYQFSIDSGNFRARGVPEDTPQGGRFGASVSANQFGGVWIGSPMTSTVVQSRGICIFMDRGWG